MPAPSKERIRIAMAFHSKGISKHNETLGRRAQRQGITEYHSRDLPPTKRKRLEENENTEDLSGLDRSDSESILEPSMMFREEIPDSQEEDCLDDDSDSYGYVRLSDPKPTELENALAPIKTDKEAITEYELMRVAEEVTISDLKARLHTGGWTKGRSSIYVDAFNLTLDTVLDDETHLFDEVELEVFNQWRSLDYESQYLYVRLFLRKTAAWHRTSRLGYHGDIADLSAAVDDLLAHRSLPRSSAEPTVAPGERVSPESLSMAETFTFAGSEAEISTLDEASSLLNLEELKLIAREAKIPGKNKGDLLRSLRRMSQQQSSLSWSGLKRYDSRQNSGFDDSDIDEAHGPGPVVHLASHCDVTKADDDPLNGESRDDYFVRKILACVGPCIRLSSATLKLFERVHLVFYRSTEWTEKSLTTIILARISRRNFPQYVVSRSANIFASRPILLEFEAALRTQFRLDSILEFNGPPGKKGYDEVLSIFDNVYPRWKLLLKSEQRKEECVYESGEGAYLRRFSPAWVYTRIVHKACYVLGRYKMHEREWQILTELLDQKLFHAARRGAWYQRKALLEEHYMAKINPIPSVGDLHQQRQHWRRESLRTCECGLQDRDCHLIYHYDLQKRVQKLERSLKLAKREQHDFSHVLLRQPKEINVTGIRVQKEISVPKKTHLSEERRNSTKTIWIDEREGGGECSVESMCLSWYREQGWRGYHAEGGIIRTLFAYLFYDVLFTYIPNVFQTPYQTCPLDLHTDAFYPSRASEINHRLMDIANGDAERLIREVDGQERQNKTCVIGLDWDFDLRDLLEIAQCFNGTALATVCKVMAQEYRQRGGGMPDLFLWSPERKEVMFSEVKSENDRLSDTQRLWIHVLTGAGIQVELCNAIAKGVHVKRE